jgi:hypothetical protein
MIESNLVKRKLLCIKYSAPQTLITAITLLDEQNLLKRRGIYYKTRAPRYQPRSYVTPSSRRCNRDLIQSLCFA